MRAYVLVKVATGSERAAMDDLKSLASVVEIHFLFGDFDYILTLDSPDTLSLARLITQRIRRVPGVEQTITLLEAPI